MADAGVIEALRAAGAPAEVIAKVEADALAKSSADDFEVLPECWDSVRSFLDLQTSWDWVTPGMGSPQRVGIRATEIDAALRLAGIRGKVRAQVYEDLRVMESAALAAFNEIRER